MSDSQADIDALLAEAQSLATLAPPEEPDPAPTPPPVHPKAPPVNRSSRSEDLERILLLEVPVIVKLAECDMPCSRVVGLSPGAIIEFDKPSEDPLELMINNKCIGLGQAVKVGENFGLRIMDIGTLKDKIAALGNE